MGFVIALVGIAAFLVAPFSGWVAFSSFRDGNASLGWKASAVSIVSVMVILFTMHRGPMRHLTDCYTEWDGRSNPTVCD